MSVTVKVIAAKLLQSAVVVGTAIVFKGAPIEGGKTADFMLSHRIEPGEDTTDTGILAAIKDAGIPPNFIVALYAKPVETLKDDIELVELEEVGEITFDDSDDSTGEGVEE